MIVRQYRQKIVTLFGISLLMLATLPAHAVDGLTGKAKVSIGEQTQTARFYMVKDALRIEFEEPVRGFSGHIDTMITHADGTFYSINQDGQAYVTKAGDEQTHASVLHVSELEKACSQQGTSCKELGEKTVAGRAASGHKIIGPDETNIIWVDNETGFVLVMKEKEDGKFKTDWKAVEVESNDISRDMFVVSNAKENKGMQKMMNSLKQMKKEMKRRRQEAMQGG